jgi:medium-chain acyl-[acyl-carrier-protein] hydrolase
MPLTAWLNFPKPNPKASLRLLCLPYAGGSAMLFRTWPNLLPPDIEICAIELPGRGVRIREPPFTRMDPLVAGLAEAVKSILDKPFAIFGYSLGAMIGFELARYLRQTANNKPVHLFVAGRQAPQIPPARPPRYNLPDAEFIEELGRLNGTPKEIFEHPELTQLMLPMLRADFELVETYSYRSGPPLDVPISAYGGLEDPETPRNELEAWREQTTASFRLQMFPGDHFFLNTSPSVVIQSLARELAVSARVIGADRR